MNKQSDKRELTADELDAVSGGWAGLMAMAMAMSSTGSNFNEAQTLTSSVTKKMDDTGNAVIQKI